MIRKFAYLLALARERHFGRAADALNISQPTLSNALQSLEEELRVTIVERGRTFQGFTPEGMRVLDSARRVLSEVHNLEQELSVLTQGLTGKLRMGVIPTALPVVAQLTQPFRVRYPQVSISVISSSSREILRGLTEYEMDAGLTYINNEPLSDVRMVPLYSERYVLLTKDKSRFGTRKTVTWAEASELELCMLSADMQNRRIAEGAFQAAGRAITPSLETNSVFTLLNAARFGPWSSIMPAQFQDLLPAHSEVGCYNLIEPDLRYTIGIIYPNRDPPPPLAKALANLIHDEKIAARIAAVTSQGL